MCSPGLNFIRGTLQDHALRETLDKDGKPCVRRKCPAKQEATAFKVNLRISWDGLEQTTAIQDIVPVHMLLGTEFDFMCVRPLYLNGGCPSRADSLNRPQIVRECVIDESKGRRYASITHVPDVGHMVSALLSHYDRLLKQQFAGHSSKTKRCGQDDLGYLDPDFSSRNYC